MSRTPALCCPANEDQSTYMVEVLWGDSVWICSTLFSGGSLPSSVVSTRKSARACHLMAFHGWYSISCSLNSIVHFINLPDAWGLSSTCRRKASVNTWMGYDWKYGHSFQTAKIMANASFSSCWYRISASWKDYMMK